MKTTDKHGLEITAKSMETFKRADDLLNSLAPSFLKHFNTCDTNTLSHGIIKLTSNYFTSEKGYLIPENVETVNIGHESNGKTHTVSVSVRIAVGNERLVFVLDYVTHTKEPMIKFQSYHMGDTVKIVEAWKKSFEETAK